MIKITSFTYPLYCLSGARHQQVRDVILIRLG